MLLRFAVVNSGRSCFAYERRRRIIFVKELNPGEIEGYDDEILV